MNQAISQSAAIDQALALVVRHFTGITDKDGEPYVMHCLRVMMGAGDGVDERLVALMHDLVEDTPVTLDDLRKHGFSEAVVEAVGLVTHQEHDTYAEYVVRLKSNPLALRAKMADLRDNASLNRALFREPSLEHDTHRMSRYLLTYQYLDDRISEETYRRCMSKFES